jgi:hypothetical protein
MSRAYPLFVIVVLGSVAGCAFNTHGNRRHDSSIVTRFAELRRNVGKPVRLVGTARAPRDAGGSVWLDLRGGTVEIPAYEWDPSYIDQPVTVSGTLFDAPPPSKGAPRVYRLGEIESAARWSR